MQRLSIARSLATRLQSRQAARPAAAHRRARSDSALLIVVPGAFALAGALALITLLVRSKRRPPDELVAATIESIGDAVIVTEPDSGVIAAVNRRLAELVPELEVGGRVDAEDSPLPSLQAALRGETVVEHQGRWLAVTAHRLGRDHDEGREDSDGVVWTVRDMSERTRLERAKSDFVATASHELLSPLTSIKGFVELLQRSSENMSERQREFIEIILKSTDRLVDLVNDLLDVARIEADHVEIHRRPIDVGEAVHEVTELINPRIAEKRQRLTTHVAPTVPLALADPDRVRQIVANLLTNAHLYTPEGGDIQVTVESDRAWVQIAVEDSGVGMTKEEVDRVFERFYRAGNRSESSPGTGLGLSIVKSLVDLHGGRISVDSEPGRGSSFRVQLPAAVPEPDSAPAVSAGRSRVLVVGREDLRPLLQPALGELGIEYHWETSGPAGARACRERRFEVALVDVGIRNPQVVMQALDLRGRRVRRAMILLSDGRTPTPPGVGKLGMEVVPVQYAAPAVLAALRAER